MNDFWISPFEKRKGSHIKLSPLQIEAIQTRLAVRRRASRLLDQEAEKAFPQVTYADDVVEKLHTMGSSTGEAALATVTNLDTFRAAKEDVERPTEVTVVSPVVSVESTPEDGTLDLAAIRARIEAVRTDKGAA